MTASTKDLIERIAAIQAGETHEVTAVLKACRDALERLTQPGGDVDPVATIRECNGVYQVFWHKAPPDDGTQLCVATDLARLIAERDAALRVTFDPKVLADMNTMQEQVKVLRAAIDKLARLGNEPHLGNSLGNQIAYEALAATEPKEAP